MNGFNERGTTRLQQLIPIAGLIGYIWWTALYFRDNPSIHAGSTIFSLVLAVAVVGVIYWTRTLENNKHKRLVFALGAIFIVALGLFLHTVSLETFKLAGICLVGLTLVGLILFIDTLLRAFGDWFHKDIQEWEESSLHDMVHDDQPA